MIYRASLAVAAFMFAILMARWLERGDYFDPVRQRRHCAAPPAAIEVWAYTSRTRQSSDLANLDRWVQQHPDEVNRPFGAFCWTALHTAARFGREDLAERLIVGGADVGARDDPGGQTALHVAAQYGNATVAALLLARGADVNAATTKGGRTPLHDAVFGLAGASGLEGRLEVAKLLLSHGANVSAREAGSRRTPLDAAAASSDRANSQRMTELLLAAGAKADTGESFNESALEQAASHNNIAAVQRLLEHGADPNAGGRDTSPLGAAAYQGHVEVVALLLGRGADANRTVPGSRFDGNGAPLAMALAPMLGVSPAVLDRRLAVVNLLLDHRANIDARDRQGRTALHGAASRGEVKTVELLLSRRAAINPADAQGLTPLHFAVREGHVAVAERLLERGADVQAKAKDSSTPLGLAAGDREMEELVRRHANR